jgi:hypothetical protein
MHNTNTLKLNLDPFDCSKPRRVRLQTKIHALDDNPDDEKSEDAHALKMAAAGSTSTTNALAKALKEEEHLKAKRRRSKVKVTHWRAQTHTISHTAALD